VTDEKSTGYKSIHLLFNLRGTKDTYCTELQLRTLLQDVWGELEHSLSYKKGKINPHIAESFRLLGKELENYDYLLKHLRTTSDKDRTARRYGLEKARPVAYFNYDNDIIPEYFKKNKQEQFAEYVKFMRSNSSLLGRTLPVTKANTLLKTLIGDISQDDRDNDPNLEYFIEMEKAIILFYDRKYDMAKNKYEEILKKFDQRCVVHFRMGELFLIKEDLVNALSEFDISYELLEGKKHTGDIHNGYHILKTLAYIYWELGKEFIGECIEYINKAKKVFDDNRGIFTKGIDLLSLANVICYYHLELWLITDDKKNAEKDKVNHGELAALAEKQKKEALAYLEVLEGLLSNNDASSNMFDTVAWFYFNLYKKTRDRESLERAKSLCPDIGDKTNWSTLPWTSSNVQMGHIQEIMLEK
jgi:tetratricopeptide (TPR) repeat protein